MLSYRHAFHAANAADVLKHSILVFCLDYLLRKEKPLLCVDTHAGAGRYILNEGFAAQKREWEQGLWKLTGGMNCGDNRPGKPLPAMLDRYVQLCRFLSGGEDAARILMYPGSPLFMAALLRPADRLVCFETHPADFRECEGVLAGRAE
ncbi:MAG: 23S rRNA (adenine(2030)-N(6))-methyltransferase RlmJ, partial [Treponema sp.]|nr:23S rRNA (adenine(2030)-N(6))-methyltransferase RlmJ [Treponema sp.]